MEFKLEDAKVVAEELVALIKPYCEEIRIVGSIRREKEFVHDIDIVLVPKPCFPNFWADIAMLLTEKEAEIFKKGKSIVSGTFRGIPFDIYRADPDTFETLMLIRTGSKEHNIKLCSLAKKMGWKLHADGKGLCFGNVIMASTEWEILTKLLGDYVEPKDREVKAWKANGNSQRPGRI